MEVAEARAKLVHHSDTGPSAALTLTVPRRHVEEALSEQEPVDLVLQFTRTTDGDAAGETGQIAVAWERNELEDLLGSSADDSITIVFDEEELRRMLDPEFEAHGMRGALAVLAVAVAAGGSAAVASAQPAEFTGIGGSGTIQHVESTAALGGDIEAVRAAAAAHSASLASASGIEAVRSAEPLAASDTSALAGASGIEAVRSAEPLAAPDTGVLASSGIEAVRSAEPLAASDTSALAGASGIEAVRSTEPIGAAETSLARASGIEAIRSAEPLAAADTTSLAGASGIEAVRSAEPLAAPDTGVLASSAIEGVRSAEAAASRAPVATDGGIAISMPSPETTAAVLGGFALLITGAAFVARSKRHELRLP